jgi:hypothetical protein
MSLTPCDRCVYPTQNAYGESARLLINETPIHHLPKQGNLSLIIQMDNLAIATASTSELRS